MHPLDILGTIVWSALALITAITFIRSVRLVPNRTELIVERLGRYHETLGPGFHVLFPFFDRVQFSVDLKEESIDVPPQEAFTKDNVRVEVDGILYMAVKNSKLASYGITDYRFAAIQLAQTTTRAVIGTLDLDSTFEERESINARVISALNEVAGSWGIEIKRYEVKNIVPPISVREAMERQMGAERDRRALLARSEGEKQSRINDSEGKKQEFINRSEGEKQRRINEADGKAQEILALAKATADSIRTVARAMTKPGGADAVNLQLSQNYLGHLRSLGAQGAQVVLPVNLLDLDQVLVGVRVARQAPDVGGTPAPVPAAFNPAAPPSPVPPRMPPVPVPQPTPLKEPR